MANKVITELQLRSLLGEAHDTHSLFTLTLLLPPGHPHEHVQISGTLEELRELFERQLFEADALDAVSKVRRYLTEITDPGRDAAAVRADVAAILDGCHV